METSVSPSLPIQFWLHVRMPGARLASFVSPALLMWLDVLIMLRARQLCIVCHPFSPQASFRFPGPRASSLPDVMLWLLLTSKGSQRMRNHYAEHVIP